MYTAKHISKRFEKRPLFSDISLQVTAGECLGIVCLDRVTRVALMDVLSGAMPADSGTIAVNGMEIDSETSSARNMIGYVPEKTPTYRGMTSRAAMKFQGSARGMSAREVSTAIDKVIKTLGVQDVADKPGTRLSPSAARMVSIAQAAFYEPDTLIIDQPTSGLDARDKLVLRDALQKLRAVHAIILSSDNLTELCGLCDRLMVIQGGRLASIGTPADLSAMRLRDDAVELTVIGGKDAVVKALSAVPGATVDQAAEDGDEVSLTVRMDGDKRADIARAIVSANIPLLRLVQATRPMDDILMALDTDRLTVDDDDADGDDTTAGAPDEGSFEKA